MNKDNKPKELRVTLDSEAAHAYESMIHKLKELAPAIKAPPSEFVSFLVSDFYLAHFEKDQDILIAEFFDSDSFYQQQRKQAKGKPNFEELMAGALNQAQKIKSKKRRKAKPLKSPETTLNASEPHEKV